MVASHNDNSRVMAVGAVRSCWLNDTWSVLMKRKWCKLVLWATRKMRMAREGEWQPLRLHSSPRVERYWTCWCSWRNCSPRRLIKIRITKLWHWWRFIRLRMSFYCFDLVSVIFTSWNCLQLYSAPADDLHGTSLLSATFPKKIKVTHEISQARHLELHCCALVDSWKLINERNCFRLLALTFISGNFFRRRFNAFVKAGYVTCI